MAGPRTEVGDRDLLRFLTCGGVDDGKSTLIGRLLHDAGLVPEDQLAELAADSRRQGNTGDAPDFSLLLDGLQAEREQGITIDVAYRFFATPKRRFIVADAPGHEQYTRNMATGASNAELAVILVDARKGVLTQTLRHSHIAAMFGIRHVVLAVSKMDLVDYAEDVFDRISEDYRRAVAALAFEAVACIPVSALAGDNVFAPSAAMDWYDGPTLMAHLETIEPAAGAEDGPFRLPVQWINRPDAEFRGYSGTITAGRVRPGDAVVAMPSGRTGRIARVVTADGDLEEAVAADAVTVTLEEEIDIGRGDVIAAADDPPDITDQFRGTLLWMDAEPMLPGRTYEIKIGASTAMATVSDLRYAVNVNTREHVAARSLALNEIGVVNIGLDRVVAFDPFADNRDGGAFILIDRYTRNTVGAGTVAYGLRRATNVKWQQLEVDKAARARIKSQRPCVLWFTGLSGSGKSTIANLVEKRLHALGRHTQTLDGDNVRHGLNRDLGFTDADRVENIRRIAEVSKLFVEAGLIVLVSFISPFRSERRNARELLEEGEFLEVFVDTPIEVCEARDPKGLYAKVRAGEIANFTGFDSPYETPEAPEIHLRTVDLAAEESADRIVAHLREAGFI